MTEALVIDTNVIEHVFNPAMNVNGHIESLLRKFSEQRRKLCLDRPKEGKQSRIFAEYQHRLQFYSKKMEDIGLVSHWIRYLVLFADRIDAPVDLSDKLGKHFVPAMKAVKAETSDQIFVYVACALDSVMVSNNSLHVTDIREHLQAAAQKVGSHNTDFISSIEADAAM